MTAIRRDDGQGKAGRPGPAGGRAGENLVGVASSDVPVLIAGGGPAGLTLAISLGQLGVGCEVVDVRPAPARVPRADRCGSRAMEIFRRLGFSGRLRAAGLPAEAPLILSQYTLEPLLREEAEATPGVSVRFGTELIDFAVAGGAITAMVRTGGRLRTVRTDYLVGCDGADSTVRQMLGIVLNGETRQPVRQ